MLENCPDNKISLMKEKESWSTETWHCQKSCWVFLGPQNTRLLSLHREGSLSTKMIQAGDQVMSVFVLEEGRGYHAFPPMRHPLSLTGSRQTLSPSPLTPHQIPTAHSLWDLGRQAGSKLFGGQMEEEAGGYCAWQALHGEALLYCWEALSAGSLKHLPSILSPHALHGSVQHR